jgi:hypothetical protein
LIENSELIEQYNEVIDRKSAFEILSRKLEQEEVVEEETKVSKTTKRTSKEKSTVEKVLSSSVTRTIMREVTRGLLGVLGIKSSTRRKKNSWF